MSPALALIHRYPGERPRIGLGVAIALGIHLFLVIVAGLVLSLLDIHSLREMLDKGGAIAAGAPAPEQPMVVELKADQVKPPPTDQVEFIRQILQPKPVPVIPKPQPTPLPVPVVIAPQPVPSPVPVPIPQPMPQPMPVAAKPQPQPIPKPSKPIVAMRPKYTAPKATGEGKSDSVSAFVLGSSGLPHPSYPYQALMAREEGTVLIEVSFDSVGSVARAEVIQSSGVSILDSSTRSFIYAHWHNSSLALRKVDVPIQYSLGPK